MSEFPREAPLTPAEQRLLSLLLLLRGAEAPADPAFARRVIGSVRWQRTLRDVLTAVSHLASAAAEGLAMLAGGKRRQR